MGYGGPHAAFFAAKEKNLEFKRILREVVLNLSTMKSSESTAPYFDGDGQGGQKLDVRVGLFSGLRIQIAERNARISHLQQQLSEYVASTPIRSQASPEDGGTKDMVRETSKLQKSMAFSKSAFIFFSLHIQKAKKID